MSRRYKTLFIVGLLFSFCGSFLPWQHGGDFLPYWRMGIRFYPNFEDNGGVLIVLLSIIIAYQYFCYPVFSKHSIKWLVLSCVVMAALSFFHFFYWFETFIRERGMVGVPLIQAGLIMVIIGSSILLLSARSLSRNQ